MPLVSKGFPAGGPNSIELMGCRVGMRTRKDLFWRSVCAE